MIAFLGLEVVHLNNQVDNLAAPRRPENDLVVAASHALGDPGARRAALRSSDGRLAAEAVLLPDGTGYMVSSALPALPADRTYQLWAVTGGQKISAGVLGRDPQIVAFHYADSTVSAFAVTDEHAGGVVSSLNAPVVVGQVRSA